MATSLTTHARAKSATLTAAIALGSLAMLGPFYWLIVATTRTDAENRATPPNLLPGTELVDNVVGLFESTDFGRALVNSLVVALSYTAFGIVVCSMAGYAFAKFRFRGKSVLFGAVLVVLALPSQVTLVPLFQLMVWIGWLDTYQALILPNLALPFGIFLMRQTMGSIPDDLLNAARVDGAGEFRVFAQVALPTMRPALSALGIFLFLGQWNDFVYPLVILRTPEAYTVPVAIATLKGVAQTDFSQILAGTAISVVPVLILFLFLQRYFVSGLLSGSVKQ